MMTFEFLLKKVLFYYCDHEIVLINYLSGYYTWFYARNKK